MHRVKKKIRVGLDFDGVVAYNPLRILRAPIASIKQIVLGKAETKFFIPKTPWQRALWWFPHQLSILPAPGLDTLRTLVRSGRVEAHIVSGRYGYLSPSLSRWLLWHDAAEFFAGIHTNERDEQPHRFKRRMIEQLNLDYFIEDNLDIVTYLSKSQKTRVFWIYNLFDRFHPYPYKFPHLREALDAIITGHHIKDTRSVQRSGVSHSEK